MEIYATIKEMVQLGRDGELLSYPVEYTKLPRLKEPTMKHHYRKNPLTDVTVEAQASVSYDFQSVRFGVTVTVKNIPMETAEGYQDVLQDICMSRINTLETGAQEFLTGLVEKRNNR